MATKFGRKQLPPGLSQDSFRYMGRPAKEQGDFGSDVGIADMVCCKQFGGDNNDKGYHAGVVQSGARWFVYTEWGRRVASGKRSWDGSFIGQDFMFEEFSCEADARKAFAKTCKGKNMDRIEKDSNGIWVARDGKDGYFVQKLATRATGLPNAYMIKDSEGLAPPAPTAAKKPAGKRAAAVVKSVGGNYHPQETRLVRDLIGGTQSYVQSASAAAGGVTPTLSSIQEVKNLLPAALGHIVRIGASVPKKPNEGHQDYARRLALACTKDTDLQNLSSFVASQVPRPVAGRNADAETRALAAILSGDNILALQQDLDTFESALQNTDFSLETAPSALDVDAAFNAQVRWLDPAGALGKWVVNTYSGMSRNKHQHLSGKVRVLNVFEVTRPDRDALFLDAAKTIAAKRKGLSSFQKANLQPANRPDISDLDLYNRSNTFLGIHGTRAVSIAPIMGGNFRLPKSLPGAQITGAAFGHGCYFAVDLKKSHGYTGHGGSYWTSSSGSVKNRGFFMFLCDVAMGNPYMCTSTGSWNEPPRGTDSIFAEPNHCRSLQNDEIIIFDPNQQRIRYLIEGEF